MADEFAEFGGAEIEFDEFAEFGGQAISLSDAMGTPASDHAKSLGQALLDALQNTMVQRPQEQMQFMKGLGQGAVRRSAGPEASEAEQIGTTIGRAALPMAGAALAGAALPAAAPAMAMIGAEGLGAAAGALAGMGGAKVLGGEAPDSAEDAALEAAKIGGTQFLGGALGRGAIAAIKTAAPRLLQTLQIVPAESLKRVIDRPAVIRNGNITQLGIELRGVVALRRVQNAVEAERVSLGKAVENALNKFQAVTKGKPVINAAGAADEALGVLDDMMVSGPGVQGALDELIPPRELNAIRGLADQIRKSPMLSAKDAVTLRRNIDGLLSFNRGGAQAVSSDVGQRALHAMGKGLRGAISESAKANNFTELAKANMKFSSFADVYDGVSRDIGTKLSDSGALKAKLANISRRYNEGGLDQARLLGLKNIAPSAAKYVDDLLDLAAAREFLLGVTRTPSGIPMSVLRSIIPKLGVAKALPLAKQAEAVTQILLRAGLPAGTAAKLSEGNRSPR